MRLVSLGLLCLTLLLSGCRETQHATPLPEGDARRAATAFNALSVDLYQQLGDGGGNLFFSAPSIGLAVSMAWTGAGGETEKQMGRLLHFDGPRDSSLADLGTYLGGLQRPEAPYRIDLANRLWGQESFSFQEAYLQQIEQVFAGGFETADFRDQPERQRERINAWVADRTHDRIVDLLPSGSVQTGTRLVLTNAVYFQADWVKPFKDKATRDRDFHTADGVKSVPTMFQAENFPLYEDDEVAILALPYKGEELDFVVVLPSKRMGLSALEKKLSPGYLDTRLDALESRWTHVELPLLEFDMGFDLGRSLRALGMTQAFDPDRADLSGISPDGPLFIGAAVHKSYLRVDEKGTEAAAATGITIGVTSMPPTATLFRADHPFLFLIRDRETGAYLFMGRVTDPA